MQSDNVFLVVTCWFSLKESKAAAVKIVVVAVTVFFVDWLMA